MQPLVSVLMTSFNREKYIAEAIESVLASTYNDFELIIVDDCSKDQTVKIANSYAEGDSRVKIYQNLENLTQWPNRNKAANLAKGKYIKYLDSDDAIYDWGLGYCVEIMEKYPDAAIGLVSKNPDLKQEYYSSKDAIQTNFFKRSILNIGPSGTILRRDAFEKVGFYDPQYGVPSDMYFNLKMASAYPVVLLQKDFFFYRIHDEREYNNRYSYLMNDYKYLTDALQLPGFQLTEDQKKVILDHAQKSFVQQFLIYIKNTGQVAKALKAISYSGIGITGFIKGILKNF
jgi:glycosyltransferase involved in cell wall biosynthesis